MKFINIDWWNSAWETWTYESSNTFTITWDLSSKYQVWQRIKLSNPTVKYFYVLKVSFSSWVTTVTIWAWTDYTLSNSEITNRYYSNNPIPNWFPSSFNWTPTVTWFSVNPTLWVARFSVIWKLMTINVQWTWNWTSNSASYTTSTPHSVISAWENQWLCWYAVDNGASIQPATSCFIWNWSSTITNQRVFDNTASWIASWWKRQNFCMTFPFYL